MKLQILQVAKTRDRNLATLEAEYEKRLSPFAKLENLTFPASKSDERSRVQSDESAHFLAKLDRDAAVIVLDERGTLLTTEEFAAAQHRIALSKMTFTHEMVRVFLKEQLYRAFSVLAGKKYNK